MAAPILNVILISVLIKIIKNVYIYFQKKIGNNVIDVAVADLNM